MAGFNTGLVLIHGSCFLSESSRIKKKKKNGFTQIESNRKVFPGWRVQERNSSLFSFQCIFNTGFDKNWREQVFQINDNEKIGIHKGIFF